jgi:hypothetical protein
MSNTMMMRTVLFVLIGIAAGAAGFWFYNEQQRPGVDISVGRDGVSIQGR